MEETRVGYCALNALRDIYLEETISSHEKGLPANPNLIAKADGLNLMINEDIFIFDGEVRHK